MRYKFPVLSTFLLLGCAAPSDTGRSAAPDLVTQTVEYPSGKDRVSGYLCRPAGEEPLPAVLLIHGDFGLTKWVKEQAQRLAGQGYLVLAVDLYRGHVVTDLEDAHIMDRGLPEERVARDLKSAVDYLAGRADVNADALGTVGFDMGGGYALEAAVRDPRLRAVVTCYARPITDAKLLAPLKASVFALYAGRDKGISLDAIEQFRVAMNKAGKHLAAMKVYTACGHGFLDATNWPAHGAPPPADVEDAWRWIVNYLNGELKR